jgi:hypothetical protein
MKTNKIRKEKRITELSRQARRERSGSLNNISVSYSRANSNGRSDPELCRHDGMLLTPSNIRI